jgi:hypothetical protein
MPALATTTSRRPPKPGKRLGQDDLEAGAIAHVDCCDDVPGTVLLKQFSSQVEIIVTGCGVTIVVAYRSADVDGDHRRTFGGQSDGVAAALAARCTGDERYLALQRSYCRSFQE